jgi:cation:H+ antiporter
MLLQVFLLILSFVMLYYGAEFALEAAEKIGYYFGLSPLVIGLLIVGFGTSLPEFFVSQLACFNGQSEIAMGNIVGSNIANLFLILGVSGCLTSLHIARKEILEQFYLHLVLTALLVITLLQTHLNYWTGGMLVAFFSYYLFDTFKQMKKERHMAHFDAEDEHTQISIKEAFLLILGFVLLYFGGEVLVTSGSKIATILGVDNYIISVIFVAFGTSLPELITALLACKRGKNTDLITGNVIGSNIFNVAFVLASLTGYHIQVGNNFKYEIIALVSASIFLLILAHLKKNFSKIAGGLFLCVYAAMIYHWL